MKQNFNLYVFPLGKKKKKNIWPEQALLFPKSLRKMQNLDNPFQNKRDEDRLSIETDILSGSDHAKWC